MKAILSLLLLFVGSVISKRFVTDCNRWGKCPKGWVQTYSGNTGREFVCVCERFGLTNDPCERAKIECRYPTAPNCTYVDTVCPPESILELCDNQNGFKHPQACDRAAEKIRLREEAKDTEKKPDLCSELKKTCLDGGMYARYSCEVLPKHCDINTINELCEIGKVTDVDSCLPAKKAKRKLEEEKTKYTCDVSVFNCDKYSLYSLPLNCTTIPTYCGSESIAKACYKDIFKNTTICDDAIKKSQYLTMQEIDEDKCNPLPELCDTGHYDACADIPAVCGEPVVTAMCKKKNYVLKHDANYKAMCNGVDITENNSGCLTLAHYCENYQIGCKLAEKYCDLRTILDLCKMNYLDRNEYKCRTAFIRYHYNG